MRSLFGFLANVVAGPRCGVCGVRTRRPDIEAEVNHPGETA